MFLEVEEGERDREVGEVKRTEVSLASQTLARETRVPMGSMEPPFILY